MKKTKKAHLIFYLKLYMASVNLMVTSCTGICLEHQLSIFWLRGVWFLEDLNFIFLSDGWIWRWWTDDKRKFWTSHVWGWRRWPKLEHIWFLHNHYNPSTSCSSASRISDGGLNEKDWYVRSSYKVYKSNFLHLLKGEFQICTFGWWT